MKEERKNLRYILSKAPLAEKELVSSDLEVIDPEEVLQTLEGHSRCVIVMTFKFLPMVAIFFIQ